MDVGVFSIGDRTRDPASGLVPTEQDRLASLVRIAVHAEQAGFQVFALGEHHNPHFVSSSQATVLSFIAARTTTLKLSTTTTLITTNDPVRLAEEFASLQHLSDDRVDLVLGRGNTAPVYSWFGQDVRQGIPLAVENYDLLRQLWDQDVTTWQGRFRTPLTGFTSVPRPLHGKAPFVWHGSVRSPEIAEQAAAHGDGFFVNNLFTPVSYSAQQVNFFRDRWAAHGRDPRAAVVGAGGALFVRVTSQQAFTAFRPYFESSPVLSSSGSLEQTAAQTGLTVGSPAQVVDKVLSMHEAFGGHQRQLFAVDTAGLPERAVHETIELAGSQVLPVLQAQLQRPTSGLAATAS